MTHLIKSISGVATTASHCIPRVATTSNEYRVADNVPLTSIGDKLKEKREYLFRDESMRVKMFFSFVSVDECFIYRVNIEFNHFKFKENDSIAIRVES